MNIAPAVTRKKVSSVLEEDTSHGSGSGVAAGKGVTRDAAEEEEEEEAGHVTGTGESPQGTGLHYLLWTVTEVMKKAVSRHPPNLAWDESQQQFKSQRGKRPKRDQKRGPPVPGRQGWSTQRE